MSKKPCNKLVIALILRQYERASSRKQSKDKPYQKCARPRLDNIRSGREDGSANNRLYKRKIERIGEKIQYAPTACQFQIYDALKMMGVCYG